MNRMVRNRRNLILHRTAGKRLLMLALVSGLVWGAGVWAGWESAAVESSAHGQRDQEAFCRQLAWWGSLYPRMSMRDSLHLVDDSRTDGGDIGVGVSLDDGWSVNTGIAADRASEEIRVVIRWKCLEWFRKDS